MSAILNRKFVLLLTLYIFVFGCNLFARDAQDKFSEKYMIAVELYNKGMLQAAEIEFETLLSTEEINKKSFICDIQSYLALISIESNRPNMDDKYNQIEKYWSNSSLISLVRLRYASQLFDREQYEQAIAIYELIDINNLAKPDRNEYNFKKGYSFFHIGDSQTAISLLGEVINAPFDSFTNPAYYYSAHMHYVRREFNKAIALFEKINHDPRFSLFSKYYILESKFMLKDYAYVTEKGDALYNELNGELKTKSARVISEAYFAQNNIEKAKLYLDKYTATKSLISRRDLYYAGILAYTQSKYQDAIELFKQVVSLEDSITQNASYHLGRCYIEIKNKFEALNSFALASRGNFDLSIKEDAVFNYAKLSFDLNSDISKFKNYLDTYSPSEHKFNEIQNYIATSYLVNQDYKSAIEILRTIKNPNTKEVVNLQKATFLRGLQLVNLGAYRDAIPVFELSLINGSYNNNLYNVTRYWLAEAYYRNNQFKRSVDINLELATKNNDFRGNKEYSSSLYNLAYGYFKMGNFVQAENWFKRYLNLARGEILYSDEAMARLGDSHFMQRKYEEAIVAFSGISVSNKQLRQYALYQTSMAKGLLGEDNTKATLLKELVSSGITSALYPEALFELSRTLIQTGDDNTASQYLTELSQKFSNSPYYSKALLELGLINLNRGNNTIAINYYKKILEEAPQSLEAQSAIAGLENIYQNMGNAQEFLTYIDALGLSQTRTPTERELIVFNSAEKQFISGNYAAALSSLTSFIKNYPNGAKTAHAWFYLGESYQKTGKPELALDAFMKVMETGEGSFTELATLNYARISYNLENYRQAVKAYSSLSLIAKLDNNIIEANTGLMHSFFMDKQYENAIAQANKTMLLNISQQEQTQSNYIVAKSYYSLGNRVAAMKYLIDLAKNKVTPEGAESAYLIISDAFDKGDFTKVEKEVYKFSDSNTPQSYWLAKSYILLGDTFAERENWEQAKATYKSILESYPANSKDDIKEQIKMRLSKIEEKQAK